MIKPQITKEYVNAKVIGKPDFSILDQYERGEKFYEPEYSIISGIKGHH